MFLLVWIFCVAFILSPLITILFSTPENAKIGKGIMAVVYVLTLVWVIVILFFHPSPTLYPHVVSFTY